MPLAAATFLGLPYGVSLKARVWGHRVRNTPSCPAAKHPWGPRREHLLFGLILGQAESKTEGVNPSRLSQDIEP